MYEDNPLGTVTSRPSLLGVAHHPGLGLLDATASSLVGGEHLDVLGDGGGGRCQHGRGWLTHDVAVMRPYTSVESARADLANARWTAASHLLTLAPQVIPHQGVLDWMLLPI